jgi:hypothetical protein
VDAIQPALCPKAISCDNLQWKLFRLGFGVAQAIIIFRLLTIALAQFMHFGRGGWIVVSLQLSGHGAIIGNAPCWTGAEIRYAENLETPVACFKTG